MEMKRKRRTKLSNLIAKYSSGEKSTQAHSAGLNFVSKHSTTNGAGQHKDKAGSKASRTRQKRSWKKAINQDLD